MQEHHIDVHISTTVTPQNVGELDQIIDLSSELGCTGFQAIPFFPVGRGQKNQDKFELTRDDYRRIFTILDEKTALLRGKVAISQEMCFPFLFDGTKAGPRTDGPMYCAAGHDTLCIGADGTVYPCAFLRDFPLENITRDRLTTLWSEAPVLRTLRALRKSDMKRPPASPVIFLPHHAEADAGLPHIFPMVTSLRPIRHALKILTRFLLYEYHVGFCARQMLGG